MLQLGGKQSKEIMENLQIALRKFWTASANNEKIAKD